MSVCMKNWKNRLHVCANWSYPKKISIYLGLSSRQQVASLFWAENPRLPGFSSLTKIQKLGQFVLMILFQRISIQAIKKDIPGLQKW